MTRSPGLVALALAASVLAGACASSTLPADSATLAKAASDPRTGDPTAAHPASSLPSANNARSSAAPTPSASAASPTATGAPAPATGAPAPGASAAVKEAEPPKKIGARHVLIQWMGAERAPASVVRTREQARKMAEEVLRRARAGEDFARLAVEYSDEPGAASRGGSLGRFGHGQMVPAFEAAAFKLKVGEVSDIVETAFGFHVIQRTE